MKPDTKLAPGTPVTHGHYGEGTVIDEPSHGHVTVAFPSYFKGTMGTDKVWVALVSIEVAA